MNNSAYFYFQSPNDAKAITSLQSVYEEKRLDEVQLKRQGGNCFKCRNAISDISTAHYQPIKVVTRRMGEQVSAVVLCHTCYKNQKAARNNG